MNKRTTVDAGGKDQGHTIRSGLGTYGRTPRALLRDPAVSINAKAVFGLLEDYAGPDRPMPFPSARTLGEYLGCSESTVRRALRELSGAGWIRIHARADGSGKQTSNEYELCPGPVDNGGVGAVTGDRGGHGCIGGVVTGDQGTYARVTNEEEPLEEEPLKKFPSKASASPPPLHGVDGNGWESDEETRRTVAAIVRHVGLGNDARPRLGPVVHQAMERGMTSQQIFNKCGGDWNTVSSPIAVITHRLAGVGA